MSEAVAVSAAEILGGNPPAKKQRPPLPPGVTVKPVHPGATYGIHPVDKLGIKLTDAKLLETPLPAGSTPPPPPVEPPTPAPVTPDPSKPQAKINLCMACGVVTVSATGETCSECTKKIVPENPSGPAPDFSDLPKSDSELAPGGNQQQEQAQPSEAELLTAYEQMGAMFWDSIIRLMCALFGDFWMPKSADERKMVIDAFTGWMKSVAFAAFTPIQNLWMAIGLYAMPRMPKTFTQIVSWWKSRKKSPQPDRPAGEEEKKPHNFSGVDATNIESETVWKGPVV